MKYLYLYQKIVINYLIEYPDIQFLIIGPPKITGSYFASDYAKDISKLTMQGGFLPYHLHNFPAKKLDKFENLNTIATFKENITQWK